ncbi:hypothetical protein HYX18_02115 [Candidatus Woesearchaeota archaeon]|nr:hypothetical protein [Candidatus Woesearchaeota archaeon]
MVTEPVSIEQCVYFTNRTIGNGKVTAWVYKQKCQKCGKSLMSKPKDTKGKIKIRAKEYICESCGYTIPEDEYEESLNVEIIYECPHCGNKGEAVVPFKRKKVQILDEETGKKSSVEVLRFQCSKCNNNIDITKKMKGV